MKKINFKKVFRGRNVAFSLLILAVVFLFGHTALATVGGWAGEVVGGIIGLFIRAIAAILILLVGVLMDVASYSDFINAAAVAKGWIVVRDLCNMFFVVILLIIAFATILGQEEYGAKKMLPKLIMAAVLINFSKMFCGLMLDIASVVMLTFVNAFSAIGAGNILDLLGISKITKISVGSSAVDFSTIVSSYIFGLIYVLIATVVVASMLGMLVMRIVMIWILIVLSPLAFFLQAVPGKGQQYASQWWTRWSSNLIVGPVIAFFLWLSFAALQADVSPIAVSGRADTENSALNADVNTNATNSPNGLGSEAGTTAQMAKFVIAIGMLLGGMKIAQEVGGETGAALGKGMAQINKGRALAVGATVGAVKGTAKLAGRGTLGLVSQIDKGLSGSQGNERKTWAGKLAKGWGDDLQASSKKSRKTAAAKYLSNLGMGENTALAGKQVVSSQGFQTTANVIKGGAIGALAGGAIAGPAGLAAGLIGGSITGYAGSARKGRAVENVKKYEGAQTDYDRARAEQDTNEKVVNNFDENKKRASDLLLKKYATGLSADEDAEYKEKDAFVKNADNKKKYDASADYLKNNAGVVQAKKATLDSLDRGKYDRDKKIVAGTGAMGGILKNFDRFSGAKAVWADMTKDQEDAKKWVASAASNANNDTLASSGDKGSIYSSTGLSKKWKHRFDLLNKGGGDSDKALDSLVNEVGNSNIAPAKLVEMAKAIAAYEGGGASLNSATLGKLKAGLTTAGQNPAQYTNTVRQYKNYDENLMEHKPGTGNLSYETFAKNATKHEAGKDIMDVSFAKLNEKLPANFKLRDEASVNEASGEQLKAISTAMSGLIDNEIKALQSVPNAAINSEKIKQLNTAKSRLVTGDVQNLSLNNSDMIAKGANDSERRRNGYNNRQHEIMHSAGATNEAAVYESSDALQSAKLVGRIPGAGGERYDVAMGKMIASMEKAQASQEDMSQAITNQVEKWKVPNAQRVIETEKGERETVSDTSSAISSLNETIKKLKTSGGVEGQGKTTIDYSVATKDFIRSQNKSVLKPLAAMAAKNEAEINA